MQEAKKSTVLITGGAGFIGSNLCEYFCPKAIK
jgi:UDP-N-acetylglucosamine 4-epimerase